VYSENTCKKARKIPLRNHHLVVFFTHTCLDQSPLLRLLAAVAALPDSPCAPDAGPVGAPPCRGPSDGRTPLPFLAIPALFAPYDTRSREYHGPLPALLVYCLAVFSADDSVLRDTCASDAPHERLAPTPPAHSDFLSYTARLSSLACTFLLSRADTSP
jgi:hypothetical protein